MREIRTSGSEGGAGRKPRSYLYRFALSLRIFEQAFRQIARPVHDSFDPKGVAFHVEEQVAVERPFHLDAANVSEFGSGLIDE